MNKTFKSKSFLFALCAIMLSFSACKDKEKTDPAPDTTLGKLTLSMSHKVGTADLNFDTDYTNALGETMRFSMFNYFISNVKLVKEDGQLHVFNQDSSYFCIRHENGKNTYSVVLNNLPVGKYRDLEFTIGVDSLRSASDISKRQGVLDPAAGASGMYWAWNSGYIFVKCEGTSPQIAADTLGNRRFRYHIGGFGGFSSRTINNIKTVRLSLGSAGVEVKGRQTLEAMIDVDVMKIFNGPTNISVAERPTVMFNPFSVNVANNYVNMFKLEHAHIK